VWAKAALVAAVAGSGAAVAQGPSADKGWVNADDPAVEGQFGQNQGPAHEFDIPAGTLPDALAAFAKTTGVKVKLQVGADKLVGFHSAGAKGILPDMQALRAILKDTGLSFHFEGQDRVEISIRNSEQVDVTASVNSAALQQFPEPLLDTAQTVSVIPQFILQDQQATSLRDGLKNVPGIALAAGEGGSQGDNLTIRGFSARNDIFLDGIRDFGSYYRDSFDYQSIDVLQGPASVEFGRGSTGGVVNQETKQPEMHTFANMNVQLGTDAMRRVAADLNHPLDHVGGGSAIRLNLVGEETNVAERQIANTRRFGIAPSLALGLNTHTRVFLNYLHEDEDSTPDYGLPYYGAYVAPVNRSTYYGYASDNYLKTSPDILTAKMDHDLGANVTLRNVFRWANYPRNVRITEPQVNTVAALTYNGVGLAATALCNPTIANTATTAACYPVTTPAANVQVKRNQLVSNATEDTLWDQVSGSGHFKLGHVDNDAVVILEGGRERSRPTRNSYVMPYVSLLNPNPYDAFSPLTTFTAQTTHVETQSFGIGFIDTLKLTNWLEASGGVRFDYFSTQAKNAPSTATTLFTYGERLDKQPTYRAALVYKPKAAGSVYFDWGTSFNPSAESLSLSANNAISPPEYNETFEFGAKWSFLRDKLALNGSIFRTEKQNARETDPNNSANTINSGNQLVRGVQIGALGHMPAHFDLVAGYAYLDGRVESSVLNASPFAALNLSMIAKGDPRANTSPFFIHPTGFPIANVPKNSGNLFLTHAVGWRFVAGFGGNYVSARRASSTSLIALYQNAAATDVTTVPLAFKVLPGYTVLNAMLRRPINDKLEFQVNVNNLANRFFIEQPHPNHLIPGEGLNAQFGFNYKF
jgi:catecholate siderophore receptor